MRPKIKPKFHRGTIATHDRLKRSKIAMKTGFLTRKRGTPKQIGQKFPVKAGSKYGLERAGLWLTKSARIAGMSAGRAERYLEKGAEKLGRIAAAPKRLQEAYKRGYEYRSGAEQAVQTTLPASKEAQLRKEIAEKRIQYADISGRIVPADLIRRLDNFIVKLKRRLNSYGLTSSQRAALNEKLSKAEELKAEAEGIEEALKVSSGLDLARLKTREGQIKRELYALGGKHWISKAIKRPGALRRAVQRIYGKAGFDSKGRIKMSVLRELAKEKNPLGARARLSIKLRKFCVGGTSDASDAIRIPKFRAKSKWSSRARK